MIHEVVNDFPREYPVGDFNGNGWRVQTQVCARVELGLCDSGLKSKVAVIPD